METARVEKRLFYRNRWDLYQGTTLWRCSQRARSNGGWTRTSPRSRPSLRVKRVRPRTRRSLSQLARLSSFFLSLSQHTFLSKKRSPSERRADAGTPRCRATPPSTRSTRPRCSSRTQTRWPQSVYAFAASQKLQTSSRSDVPPLKTRLSRPETHAGARQLRAGLRAGRLRHRSRHAHVRLPRPPRITPLATKANDFIRISTPIRKTALCRQAADHTHPPPCCSQTDRSKGSGGSC